jgi:hypothetical protein
VPLPVAMPSGPNPFGSGIVLGKAAVWVVEEPALAEADTRPTAASAAARMAAMLNLVRMIPSFQE